MKLSQEQYNQIAKYFPVQRENVRLSNLEILNAILYVLENSCKWRALPSYFGNWHMIYTHMSRWTRGINHDIHPITTKTNTVHRIFTRYDKRTSCISLLLCAL
jgi:transposase